MFQGKEAPGSPCSPGTGSGLSEDDEGHDGSRQDSLSEDDEGHDGSRQGNDIPTDEDVDDVQQDNESEDESDDEKVKRPKVQWGPAQYHYEYGFGNRLG